MELKDKFTIIITIHERKEFAQPLLDYYQDFPCNIIVSDSSRKITSLKFNNNTKLIHAPGQLYYEKVYSALEQVKTPFVLELPDDDIVFKNAIIECVNFLDNNSDYVFVEGRWENVWQEQTEYFLKSNFYSMDPLERIIKCLNEYWKAGNHSIIRTEILKQNYEFQLQNQSLWPIRWFDKIWMFLTCFEGNYKALPVLYGRRDKTSRLISLLKGYDERLKKEITWSDILLGDSLKPLVNFCIERGYEPDFSEQFVRNVAKNI